MNEDISEPGHLFPGYSGVGKVYLVRDTLRCFPYNFELPNHCAHNEVILVKLFLRGILCKIQNRPDSFLDMPQVNGRVFLHVCG